MPMPYYDSQSCLLCFSMDELGRYGRHHISRARINRNCICCQYIYHKLRSMYSKNLQQMTAQTQSLINRDFWPYFFTGSLRHFVDLIVREAEAQRAVVMAFNTLPSRREELVVQRERLLTGEIGRIDALLKTLDGQQDRLEERLEVLASQVPEDQEPMNTTVVDEVGSTQVITSEMDEVAFLRSQIVEIRRRKDGLYAERAEHANTEVQIRLLLELVDEMVKNSLPEWMAWEAEAVEETGACRDYDDFFSRTRYTVPEGVLDENGRMEAFNNDLVIRYLDRVVVKDDGYEVAFKAGVTVEVEV